MTTTAANNYTVSSTVLDSSHKLNPSIFTTNTVINCLKNDKTEAQKVMETEILKHYNTNHNKT